MFAASDGRVGWCELYNYMNSLSLLLEDGSMKTKISSQRALKFETAIHQKFQGTTS